MTDDTTTDETANIVPMVYTVNETCEALRLSRYTVYELINTGQLRSIKIGHRRLVAHVDLVDFVEERRREAAAS